MLCYRALILYSTRFYSTLPSLLTLPLLSAFCLPLTLPSVCLLSHSPPSLLLTSPSLIGLSRMKLRMRSDLLPRIIAKSETDAGSSAVSLGENDIYSINAKLKEGLLIMSREYYRSKKSVKSVFGVSYSSSSSHTTS